MTQSPSVSVIVPAYNAAGYIAQTIDSVFAQVFKDYEIIVVNDGSPDTRELEAVLERYAGRLHYLRQDNLGAAEARNAGLRAAQADLVAFLDADDIWLPDYLNEQVAFLRRHPDCDFVYTDALLFGDPTFEGRTYMEFAPSKGDVTFESLLKAECNVVTSGVVARRQLIIEAGSFDPEIKRGQDYDLWLRLARMGARMRYQRRVLLHRRMHAESLSGDRLRQTEREVAVLERFVYKMSLPPAEKAIFDPVLAQARSNLAVEHAKRSLTEGNFAAAAEHLDQAYRENPSGKLRFIQLGLRIAPAWFQRLYRWRAGSR